MMVSMFSLNSLDSLRRLPQEHQCIKQIAREINSDVKCGAKHDDFSIIKSRKRRKKNSSIEDAIVSFEQVLLIFVPMYCRIGFSPINISERQILTSSTKSKLTFLGSRQTFFRLEKMVR
jgi:hypothetical protein